ncbi:hypothetical protein KVR01_005386 [Diaporthe batatas]|uniref:uncharacterized protein n=1 Tax=Diaporthe batatas TaxID=748121 RepID=UPI001D04B4C8|nr:uncharacterized protein KVR01_005386 [Diaporthe batatas]KAG8165111.1 hypothetical protein KVR01_005386 [Diaporthe batatas]
MKDPFPIAPIPALSEWVRPFAERFNLVVLPQHIHEVVFAAIMYTFVHLVISPWLSMKYAPKQYPTHRGKRASWDSHVVSLFQSTLINILALWCMFADEERKTFDWQQRIWGYTGASGMIQSLVAGYFVWDFIITICFVDVFGIGVLVHATSALLVYSFGYRPFLNYYANVFILYELSTPFLNIHWFFDKMGMTGSKAQLYNGIILLVTFFSARLIWGVGQSFVVWYDMYRALFTAPNTEFMSVTPADETLPGTEDIMMYAKEAGPLPYWLVAIYLVSNLALTTLNFIWFGKMIKAIRKRFDTPAEESKQEGKPVDGVARASSIVDKADEVRRRHNIPVPEIEDDLGAMQ